MADDAKDLAIYYSMDEKVGKFVEKLQSALEERGISMFPAYDGTAYDGDENVSLDQSVEMANFRIFLIDSHLLKEIRSEKNPHHQIFQKYSSKTNTILVRLDDAPKTSKIYKRLSEPEKVSLARASPQEVVVQARKVADSVKEFISANTKLESSEDTGDESLNSTHETSNQDFSYSSHNSPVQPESFQRHDASRFLETPSPTGNTLKHRNLMGELTTKAHQIYVGLTAIVSSAASYAASFTGLILLGIAASVLIPLMYNNAQEEQELTITGEFNRQIKKLEKDFPHQDRKFWRTVRSAMKGHIVDEDPRQPAVLMLVSSKSAARNREELAKRIAGAYSVRCSDEGPVLVHGNDFVDLNHADAKEAIDDVITSGLKSSCAAVVSNFQQLPPGSTTTFYQFCENDLAPFKKVVIIFTLEISPGAWDESNQFQSIFAGKGPQPTSWDRIVDDFLTYHLKNKDTNGIMKDDMIGGLLSRITPGVAWVK